MYRNITNKMLNKLNILIKLYIQSKLYIPSLWIHNKLKLSKDFLADFLIIRKNTKIHVLRLLMAINTFFSCKAL